MSRLNSSHYGPDQGVRKEHRFLHGRLPRVPLSLVVAVEPLLGSFGPDQNAGRDGRSAAPPSGSRPLVNQPETL